MEAYQGIKFCIRQEGESFAVDGRLQTLNRWVHVMAELGLAPIHPQGAYGNHSMRQEKNAFIITRSGMVPGQALVRENYCQVRYDEGEGLFVVRGRHAPSSECFLHHLLYEQFEEIGAIMHGHCGLLNSSAERLGLAVTASEHPYGTRALAEAAVETASGGASLFILRNHGFVAVGTTVEEAAAHVLTAYRRLIDLLAGDLPVVRPR